jgi:hypothetical protein
MGMVRPRRVIFVIASRSSFPTTSAQNSLHAGFLRILPHIQLHAQVYFRDEQCPDQRADRVTETIALAWTWYRRLAERGKDAGRFVSTLATLAARAVRSGRRACSTEYTKDVMSPVAQRRHGFTVTALSASTRGPFEDIRALVRGQQEIDAYEERLRDNTVTPPADAAAFRVDFVQFLASLSQRDRDLAMFLSLGHQAKRAASKFGVSPSRVSQLRQRWYREWRRCQGEEGSARPEPGANEA